MERRIAAVAQPATQAFPGFCGCDALTRLPE